MNDSPPSFADCLSFSPLSLEFSESLPEWERQAYPYTNDIFIGHVWVYVGRVDGRFRIALHDRVNPLCIVAEYATAEALMDAVAYPKCLTKLPYFLHDESRYGILAMMLDQGVLPACFFALFSREGNMDESYFSMLFSVFLSIIKKGFNANDFSPEEKNALLLMWMLESGTEFAGQFQILTDNWIPSISKSFPDFLDMEVLSSMGITHEVLNRMHTGEKLSLPYMKKFTDVSPYQVDEFGVITCRISSENEKTLWASDNDRMKRNYDNVSKLRADAQEWD